VPLDPVRLDRIVDPLLFAAGGLGLRLKRIRGVCGGPISIAPREKTKEPAGGRTATAGRVSGSSAGRGQPRDWPFS